jgi:hypothetical protein
MSTEDLLIDYFARRRIILDKGAAQYIMRLVRENNDDNIITIVKHKYNGITRSYEKIRTLFINSEKVKSILSRAPKPVEGFYKYTFKDFEIKEFFTLHPSLFG